MPDARQLQRVTVSDIACIQVDPDIFLGLVTFEFDESLDGQDYGQFVSVKLRIKHSRASSVEVLQEKFLEEALGLLDQVGRIGREGSVEQLRKSLARDDDSDF